MEHPEFVVIGGGIAGSALATSSSARTQVGIPLHKDAPHHITGGMLVENTGDCLRTCRPSALSTL